MDTEAVATTTQAKFQHLLEVLAPYSKEFGSGNVQADLVALLGVTAAVLLVMYLILLRSRSAYYVGDYEGSNGNSVRLEVKTMRTEIKNELARLKADTGYLIQEVHELKQLLFYQGAGNGDGQAHTNGQSNESRSIDPKLVRKLRDKFRRPQQAMRE